MRASLLMAAAQRETAIPGMCMSSKADGIWESRLSRSSQLGESARTIACGAHVQAVLTHVPALEFDDSIIVVDHQCANVLSLR